MRMNCQPRPPCEAARLPTREQIHTCHEIFFTLALLVDRIEPTCTIWQRTPISAAQEARADGVRVFGILALLALPGRRINGRQMTSDRRTTDGRRLCRPLLTRAGHRTHDTHEGLFVEVALVAGGAIPCGYGGHIGDRREGGSGCVLFVHAILLFYVVKMPQGRANNHTSMHPQQTRDCKKALVKRKKPVRVYQRPDVGLKEIKRKRSDLARV